MQTKLKRCLVSALLALGMTTLVGVSPAFAGTDQTQAQPPAAVSGTQAKPAVDPEKVKSQAAQATKALGDTKLRQVDAAGKSAEALPQTGYDSNVDITAVYNYCQGDLVLTAVHNNTGVTRYFENVFYANGASRTYYSSIAAYSTVYVYTYGVTGTYYSYLYVWNGSSYAYDEYRTGTNSCSVGVSITTATGYTGYVLLTIKNYGNAYASVESNELAPYPGSGTYTGLHWDYPAPNGGTIYRYYYVGTGLRYGIFADLYGATYYTPWYWYGVL